MAKKHLIRSREGVFGGVASGVASFTGADIVAVRIFMILLALSTMGVAVLLYVFLWVVLRRESESVAPYTIKPRSVHSETYGTVQVTQTDKKGLFAHEAKEQGELDDAGFAYAGVSHVPPTPPPAWIAQQALYAEQTRQRNAEAIAAIRDKA